MHSCATGLAMHKLPARLPNELTKNHDQTRWLNSRQGLAASRHAPGRSVWPRCSGECCWGFNRRKTARLLHSFSVSWKSIPNKALWVCSETLQLLLVSFFHSEPWAFNLIFLYLGNHSVVFIECPFSRQRERESRILPIKQLKVSPRRGTVYTRQLGNKATMYTTASNTQTINRRTEQNRTFVVELKGQRNLRTTQGHSHSLDSRI